jgi:hypothetical protein
MLVFREIKEFVSHVPQQNRQHRCHANTSVSCPQPWREPNRMGIIRVLRLPYTQPARESRGRLCGGRLRWGEAFIVILEQLQRAIIRPSASFVM